MVECMLAAAQASKAAGADKNYEQEMRIAGRKQQEISERETVSDNNPASFALMAAASSSSQEVVTPPQEGFSRQLDGSLSPPGLQTLPLDVLEAQCDRHRHQILDLLVLKNLKRVLLT